ncbi:hypothetical protein EEJ42_31430 [Streptomyces botrytidirepellens]|uniref:Uncharacterized protein n=2 Tax=Streptomyces botrytidirepellens TaxID=2486417 RepID=A0A3M8V9S9_9ACTN|nr:hypothetical protein EEJ42_31430 [Streptomyces botrytidirepellens]
MPPAVARLPRNRAGRPVPGNIAWYEADDDGSILVTRNDELGGHITCPCTPGRGTPRFGEQCSDRQRQLMVQRRCGLCTQAIEPTAQLVFIGESDARYYLGPPLHPLCAAYALQVCPVLHAEGERIEVALTQSYALAEDRITAVSADGALRRSAFPFGDLGAHHLAVLEFYLAFPDAPERLTAPTWLAQHDLKLLP